MCQSNSLRLLIQSANGYIGRCTGCGYYNVAYKNTLLIFSETELVSFQQILCEFIGCWCTHYPTRLGKEVGMKTPLPNLYLMFTHKEYEELHQMFEQMNFWFDARANANKNLN